jgi:hypothetical protein
MAKAQHPIFTIGYEGASVPAFIAALRDAGVALVLDIRAAPVSRKKGFSKTHLAQHLSEAGIGYRHMRGLGTPKQGREAARSGDHDSFERLFRNHLEEPEALLRRPGRSFRPRCGSARLPALSRARPAAMPSADHHPTNV